MSSPLAIAAVTAALKDLLNDGLLDHDLSSIGSFSVTALPPDRIPTGQDEPNQLNVFLYQVSANAAWRNMQLPSRDAKGTRTTNAPLALDLHYLISAYGSADFNAEVLLGYAMHLLHETPILTRAQLRTVLGGVSPIDGSILPSPFGDLSAADLAEQFELIKITPVYLSAEDLSKMWTAMQARYRPTMAYHISVVLIEGKSVSKAAPPVLQQGKDDSGPRAVASAVPILASVRPLVSELMPAARLGEQVLLSGTGLGAGANMTVLFANERLAISKSITPTPGSKSGTLLATISESAGPSTKWPIAVYSVSILVAKPDYPSYASNVVPMALAPSIQLSSTNGSAGDDIIISCFPQIEAEQEPHTQVIFSSTTIQPKTINTPADPAQPTTVTFTIPAVDAGEYLVRLRVNNIDSIPVLVSGLSARLEFDPAQKVTVA